MNDINKYKRLINLKSFTSRTQAISYFKYILSNNKDLKNEIEAFYYGLIIGLENDKTDYLKGYLIGLNVGITKAIEETNNKTLIKIREDIKKTIKQI